MAASRAERPLRAAPQRSRQRRQLTSCRQQWKNKKTVGSWEGSKETQETQLRNANAPRRRREGKHTTIETLTAGQGREQCAELGMQYFQPSAAPHKVISSSGKVSSPVLAAVFADSLPSYTPRRACTAICTAIAPEHSTSSEGMAAGHDGVEPGVTGHGFYCSFEAPIKPQVMLARQVRAV